MILTFNKSILLHKLADELIKAGINPLAEDGTSAIQGTDTEVYIYVPDNTPQTTIDQITAIVNAHDPTLPPQPPTQEERLRAVEAAILQLMGV